MLPDPLIDRTLSRFPRLAGSDIKIQKLEKGGSDRSYYRISVGADYSLVLVKYGSQRDENRHYVEIALFLRSLEIRVPEIYLHDPDEGLIWMEDLGDCDLWSFREEPWETREPLYAGAIEQLCFLHTRAHQALGTSSLSLQKEFNAELYRWEQSYFFENCLGRHFKIEPARIASESASQWLDGIARFLDTLPRVLVHRDFQSQNILIAGRDACLIDFQGLRPGLPEYDLASLLFDPYVRLTGTERAHLAGLYRAARSEAGFDVPRNFEQLLDLCAMQRLMQALGAYGYLGYVKERPEFLTHIPAAMASLKEILERIDRADSLRRLLAPL